MKRLVIGLIVGLLIGMTGTAIAAQSDTIQAVFQKFNFIVDGQEQQLDADPLVYQGTTYLPVRVVANMLGYDVTYKASDQRIELVSASEQIENSERGENNMDQVIDLDVNRIKGRALIEVLASKYPEHKEEISLNVHGLLHFQGTDYKLPDLGDGFFDAQPLIKANILSESDF